VRIPVGGVGGNEAVGIDESVVAPARFEAQDRGNVEGFTGRGRGAGKILHRMQRGIGQTLVIELESEGEAMIHRLLYLKRWRLRRVSEHLPLKMRAPAYV
jgi:hypothetical protein